MNLQNDNQTKEVQQQNATWFIFSVTGTIVTIITAGILIIQFSRNYKDKQPMQYILFMFAGITTLWLGIYMNYIIIDFINEQHYGQLAIIPRLLLKINIVFFIYSVYTGAKRLSLFFR